VASSGLGLAHQQGTELDVLAVLLTDEGHVVQTAPNGRLAVELIATPPIC
jgi:hypothetical protein